MWLKLIDIVESRWHDGSGPKHDLAQAINILYGSMTNCHTTFQRLEHERNKQSFANFAFAIDGMISTLQNLHPTLQIFDPELAERLKSYASDTRRVRNMGDPRNYAKAQIRFLRDLVHEESTLIGLPEQEFAAFGDALEKLRRFIRAQLSMDEIFGPSER